jgi:hypothetical protein
MLVKMFVAVDILVVSMILTALVLVVARFT